MVGRIRDLLEPYPRAPALVLLVDAHGEDTAAGLRQHRFEVELVRSFRQLRTRPVDPRPNVVVIAPNIADAMPVAIYAYAIHRWRGATVMGWGARPEDGLSSTEIDVLFLMRQGVTDSRGIARELGVTPGYVDRVISGLMAAFQVPNRAALVAMAIEIALVVRQEGRYRSYLDGPTDP